MTAIFGTVSLYREAVPNSFGDPNARFQVWLDARFDNRPDLAGLAGWTPGQLRNRSDEELIAALWARHGELTVQHLIGDFALALFDGPAGTLFLARDPTGQRPLHYRLSDGQCRFASMPRQLAETGDAPLSLARAVDFLVYVPDSASGSFFEQVEIVPPGSLVRVDNGGARTSRWWRPSTEILDLSIDEAVEEATALLKTAVAARLDTARPAIASQLSGGLDSGAVTAFTAEALEGTTRLLAVTAVPAGPTDSAAPRQIVDERERARMLARRYPAIEHRLAIAEPRSLFEDLPAWHALFDRPIGNYCNQLWLDRTYAEAAEAGADVMLVGLAGNYSFSFDGTMALPRLLRQGRVFQWLRTAAAWHQGGSRSWRGIAAESIGPFLPAPLWSGLQRFRRSRGLGAVEERAFVDRAHPLVRAARERARRAGMDVDGRGERDMTGFRLFALHEADPGNLNHGMRQRWGIETRDPTADRRLIEFCLRLGPEHFFDGRRSRQLARRMLRGRMDDEARLDETKALQGADWRCSAELSRPAMRAELAEIERNPELAGLFDVEAMRAAIDGWPASGWDDFRQTFDYRFKLMRTLACANWLRNGA